MKGLERARHLVEYKNIYTYIIYIFQYFLMASQLYVAFSRAWPKAACSECEGG